MNDNFLERTVKPNIGTRYTGQVKAARFGPDTEIDLAEVRNRTGSDHLLDDEALVLEGGGPAILGCRLGDALGIGESEGLFAFDLHRKIQPGSVFLTSQPVK